MRETLTPVIFPYDHQNHKLSACFSLTPEKKTAFRLLNLYEESSSSSRFSACYSSQVIGRTGFYFT
jgi:hypothetical protein